MLDTISIKLKNNVTSKGGEWLMEGDSQHQCRGRPAEAKKKRLGREDEEAAAAATIATVAALARADRGTHCRWHW